MKQWKLIRTFYSQMKAPCILLFLLMTISLLVLTIGTGYYRYMTYSQTAFQNSGLDNAVYVSYFGQECPNDLSDEFAYMRAQPCVEDVLYAIDAGAIVCREEGISLIIMPEGVYSKLPFFLPRGELFSETGLTTDGKLQCVLGAPFLKDVKKGQSLTLHDGGSDDTLDVYVTGKLRYPYFHPNFGSAGSVTADSFVTGIQIILAKDTPQTRDVLNSLTGMAYMSYFSYWVEFKDTASSAEKADFISFLRQDHHVTTYEDILKNTDKAVGEAASGALATPLYLVFITTMSFISIAILLLYKKSNQNAIWYLCGCSKRCSYIYASLAMGLICLAACLIPLLLILFYPVLGEHDLLPLGNIYLDSVNIGIILGYLAVVLGLSFLFPFLLQYKASPVDALRRLNE